MSKQIATAINYLPIKQITKCVIQTETINVKHSLSIKHVGRELYDFSDMQTPRVAIKPPLIKPYDASAGTLLGSNISLFSGPLQSGLMTYLPPEVGGGQPTGSVQVKAADTYVDGFYYWDRLTHPATNYVFDIDFKGKAPKSTEYFNISINGTTLMYQTLQLNMRSENFNFDPLVFVDGLIEAGDMQEILDNGEYNTGALGNKYTFICTDGPLPLKPIRVEVLDTARSNIGVSAFSNSAKMYVTRRQVNNAAIASDGSTDYGFTYLGRPIRTFSRWYMQKFDHLDVRAFSIMLKYWVDLNEYHGWDLDPNFHLIDQFLGEVPFDPEGVNSLDYSASNYDIYYYELFRQVREFLEKLSDNIYQRRYWANGMWANYVSGIVNNGIFGTSYNTNGGVSRSVYLFNGLWTWTPKNISDIGVKGKYSSFDFTSMLPTKILSPTKGVNDYPIFCMQRNVTYRLDRPCWQNPESGQVRKWICGLTYFYNIGNYPNPGPPNIYVRVVTGKFIPIDPNVYLNSPFQPGAQIHYNYLDSYMYDDRGRLISCIQHFEVYFPPGTPNGGPFGNTITAEIRVPLYKWVIARSHSAALLTLDGDIVSMMEEIHNDNPPTGTKVATTGMNYRSKCVMCDNRPGNWMPNVLVFSGQIYGITGPSTQSNLYIETTNGPQPYMEIPDGSYFPQSLYQSFVDVRTDISTDMSLDDILGTTPKTLTTGFYYGFSRQGNDFITYNPSSNYFNGGGGFGGGGGTTPVNAGYMGNPYSSSFGINYTYLNGAPNTWMPYSYQSGLLNAITGMYTKNYVAFCIDTRGKSLKQYLGLKLKDTLLKNIAICGCFTNRYGGVLGTIVGGSQIYNNWGDPPTNGFTGYPEWEHTKPGYSDQYGHSTPASNSGNLPNGGTVNTTINLQMGGSSDGFPFYQQSQNNIGGAYAIDYDKSSNYDMTGKIKLSYGSVSGSLRYRPYTYHSVSKTTTNPKVNDDMMDAMIADNNELYTIDISQDTLYTIIDKMVSSETLTDYIPEDGIFFILAEYILEGCSVSSLDSLKSISGITDMTFTNGNISYGFCAGNAQAQYDFGYIDPPVPTNWSSLGYNPNLANDTKSKFGIGCLWFDIEKDVYYFADPGSIVTNVSQTVVND